MIRILIFSTLLVGSGLFAPADAEAGPLLDWLRGLRTRRNCNTYAQPGTYTASYAPSQANPMGLQPGQCATTCNQTCSRTVVNYVQQTAYRTAWNRVPVTQYRPVTNSDPCTGCTVTCMKPCTTYTWQMRRVPYTTCRPVYRTETYKVPVTTISNDCSTGGCATGNCATGNCSVGYPVAGYQTNNGCTSCGVPTTSYGTPTPATNGAGTYYTNPADGSVITGDSLSTQGSFESVPADVPPTFDVNPQSSQRPSILDRMQQDSSTSWPNSSTIQRSAVIQPESNVVPVSDSNNGWDNARPAYIEVQDKTALSPVRERWSYSPVRLASYSQPVASEVRPREIRGTFEDSAKRETTAPSQDKVNAGWETVSW